MILNMLSTGAMTRLGYVYGNLMVNVHLKNTKLVERGAGILQKITGITRTEALLVLKKAGNKVPVALVMVSSHVSCNQAETALRSVKGNVRRAIAQFR
jgi:N-acetylmuramic acid 6-phosphate etherase